MSFTRNHGVLHAEQCSLQQLAQQFGTPLYVYSKATFEKHFTEMDRAFDFIDHQICFAVKSNSNIAVLNVLAKLGAGFDIVTGGELARVLKAGGDASKIVFSGLGKTEIDVQKALEVGIACFNVESHAELDRIQKVAAKLGKKAPISLRVNPDVDAKTHPYISTGLSKSTLVSSTPAFAEILRPGSIYTFKPNFSKAGFIALAYSKTVGGTSSL